MDKFADKAVDDDVGAVVVAGPVVRFLMLSKALEDEIRVTPATHVASIVTRLSPAATLKNPPSAHELPHEFCKIQFQAPLAIGCSNPTITTA